LLSEAYALLGLVPRAMDLRGMLKAIYLEQIAGFYDPDSTTLFVLDDQPDEAIESLLAHELVHAIQDQNTDLDAITAPGLNNDRRVAAQAAIEGHATLVMFEFLIREQGRGGAPRPRRPVAHRERVATGPDPLHTLLLPSGRRARP